MPRTFDNQGNQLGEGGEGAPMPAFPAPPAAQPAVNVNMPATQFSVNLAQLLQPPYSYLLIGAVVFAAWHFSKER